MMSKLDTFDAECVQLYTAHRTSEDGTDTITGYAYGPPWVAMALYMDDIKFDTPEAAIAWWENESA